jgi:hypothetical protein
VGTGTLRNEQLHGKINTAQYGISIVSLQMEVAMIETLLYRHNQKIKPDLCVTALINMSLKYLQNPPSISFSNGLGLLTGSAIVAVPSLESNSITETNIMSSNIMLSVLKSIVPNSLKYKAVEILCCSPFQPRNMFAGKTDSSRHGTLRDILSDLSMEAFFESSVWTEALIAAVSTTINISGNERFQDHVTSVLGKSLEKAVQEEMTENAHLYMEYFSSEEEYGLFKDCFTKDNTLTESKAGCIFQLCCNIFGSTIVLILPTSNSMIQTLHPSSRLLNKCAVVFACVPENTQFVAVRKIAEMQNNSVVGHKTETETRLNISCTCGKDKASSSLSCTNNSRCPCAKSFKGCFSCKCVRCDNEFGL